MYKEFSHGDKSTAYQPRKCNISTYYLVHIDVVRWFKNPRVVKSEFQLEALLNLEAHVRRSCHEAYQTTQFACEHVFRAWEWDKRIKVLLFGSNAVRAFVSCCCARARFVEAFAKSLTWVGNTVIPFLQLLKDNYQEDRSHSPGLNSVNRNPSKKYCIYLVQQQTLYQRMQLSLCWST